LLHSELRAVLLAEEPAADEAHQGEHAGEPEGTEERGEVSEDHCESFL